MAVVKIYNGASWQQGVLKTYDGSTWKDTAKYYDGTQWIDLQITLAVSPSTANVIKSSSAQPPQTVYARIRIAADGIEYQTSSATSSATTSSRGAWLDSGLSSEVWVQRVITVGTLSLDPGSGRLQLSTDRTFGVQALEGVKACSLTFNYYDAAAGGNLIGSASITLEAESPEPA